MERRLPQPPFLGDARRPACETGDRSVAAPSIYPSAPAVSQGSRAANEAVLDRAPLLRRERRQVGPRLRPVRAQLCPAQRPKSVPAFRQIGRIGSLPRSVGGTMGALLEGER